MSKSRTVSNSASPKVPMTFSWQHGTHQPYLLSSERTNLGISLMLKRNFKKKTFTETSGIVFHQLSERYGCLAHKIKHHRVYLSKNWNEARKPGPVAARRKNIPSKGCTKREWWHQAGWQWEMRPEAISPVLVGHHEDFDFYSQGEIIIRWWHEPMDIPTGSLQWTYWEWTYVGKDRRSRPRRHLLWWPTWPTPRVAGAPNGSGVGRVGGWIASNAL